MPIRFATITARYAGSCARCQGPIAVGDRIRYGAGRAYHLAAECPAAAAQTPQGATIAPAAPKVPQAPRVPQTSRQAVAAARQQLAAVDAVQAAPQAPQAAAPADIMSAAIACQLQGTFASLMARPAQLGDVEPRVRLVDTLPAAAEAGEDDGRDNGGPVVDDRDTGDREPDPEPVDVPACIATPAGPVSDRSWGTRADYGSNPAPAADDPWF